MTCNAVLYFFASCLYTEAQLDNLPASQRRVYLENEYDLRLEMQYGKLSLSAKRISVYSCQVDTETQRTVYEKGNIMLTLQQHGTDRNSILSLVIIHLVLPANPDSSFPAPEYNKLRELLSLKVRVNKLFMSNLNVFLYRRILFQ